MPETWCYRGQTMDREQLTFLREFIAAHPDSSRWKLSRQLCETLGWKQANGALRERGLPRFVVAARAGRRDRASAGPAAARSRPTQVRSAGKTLDSYPFNRKQKYFNNLQAASISWMTLRMDASAL